MGQNAENEAAAEEAATAADKPVEAAVAGVPEGQNPVVPNEDHDSFDYYTSILSSAKPDILNQSNTLPINSSNHQKPNLHTTQYRGSPEQQTQNNSSAYSVYSPIYLIS